MGENFLSFPTLGDTKRFTVVRTNKELFFLFLCPYYQELYVSGLRFLFLFAFYSHRFGYPCGEKRFT